MDKIQLTEEVLKMRFEEIYGRYKQKEISSEEAADILGMSSRSFLRKRRRYEDEEFDGRFDQRLGKICGHKAADEEVKFVTQLYADRYRGFSVKHFHEFACLDPQFTRSYSWTKNTLEAAGLIKRSKRGGDHRLRRDRRPMAGMLIHQDGSTHCWVPALEHNIDLIVTMDDATSWITSAFFVAQEGSQSSFRGIRETIETHGLFCTFYTDRGSHYFLTPEAGGKVDKHALTQVSRGLKQLGMKHIAAYSPQARGRSERMFGTLQNRLPKEFVLHGIESVEAANKYLNEIYLPRHNKQFSVASKDPKSAFMPCIGIDLKNILCVQEERTVQHDNTVRYGGMILQIPKNEYRHHYVRTKVDVHTYEDGSMAIYYGRMCVGEYDSLGNLRCIDRSENKEVERKIVA